MKKYFLALALPAIILSTSCKDDDNDNTGINQKDRDFMTMATYSNLGEVSSGNLAVGKAINASVKNFGTMMIADHGSAHQQLSSIASGHNYTLPSETDQEHKDMAQMLMMLDGDAFDSTYMYMMVQGHDKAIALHQEEIQNGRNSDVKQYAREKLEVIEHHRIMADSLAQALYP
jgi:putative membrane protein